MRKAIMIRVPDQLKIKLDALRNQGYTLNGYILGVLERELADPPVKRRQPRRGTP